MPLHRHLAFRRRGFHDMDCGQGHRQGIRDRGGKDELAEADLTARQALAARRAGLLPGGPLPFIRRKPRKPADGVTSRHTMTPRMAPPGVGLGGGYRGGD